MRTYYPLLPLLLLGALTACGADEDTSAPVPAATGTPTVELSRELPADFPVDFPTYPGATITSSVSSAPTAAGGGSVVTWRSDDAADRVIQFYRGRLAEAPWRTSSVTDSSGGILIFFASDAVPGLGGVLAVNTVEGQTVISASMSAGAAEAPPSKPLPAGFPDDVPLPDDTIVLDGTGTTEAGAQRYALRVALRGMTPAEAGANYAADLEEEGWAADSREAEGDTFNVSASQDEGRRTIDASFASSSEFSGYAEATIDVALPAE